MGKSISTMKATVLDRQRETGTALVSAELCVEGKAAHLVEVAINVTISWSKAQSHRSHSFFYVFCSVLR